MLRNSGCGDGLADPASGIIVCHGDGGAAVACLNDAVFAVVSVCPAVAGSGHVAVGVVSRHGAVDQCVLIQQVAGVVGDRVVSFPGEREAEGKQQCKQQPRHFFHRITNKVKFLVPAASVTPLCRSKITFFMCDGSITFLAIAKMVLAQLEDISNLPMESISC